MVMQFEPDYSTPLCETIRETMEERGMDLGAVALAMCEDPFTEREYGINYLVLEMLFALPDEKDMLLGESTAKGLERAFGVPASFWISRHENHRKFCASK